MSNRGYTWYYKDFFWSKKVSKLNLQERGLYRELIDYAMDEDNKQEIDFDHWAKTFNQTKEEIEPVYQKLVDIGVVEPQQDGTLFIPSCEKRLQLIRGGKKGGQRSRK